MLMSVAVVGAGYFAQFHLEAWRRLADAGRVDLVALVEPDPQRRSAAMALYRPRAAFSCLADLLAQHPPGLLDIATPPATHLSLVQRAAEAGIDCIVQKPLAPTQAEAIAVVNTARQANIRLIVHENFRFMPWYREMARCLQAGMLGSPHTVAVRMRPGDGQGANAYLSRQPYFQQMPRFLVHETAIHFIDSFRFLFGEVAAVTARLRRMNPVIAGEDAGYVVLEFERGMTGLIDANRLNDHVAENTRLTMGEHWLEGDAGVLRLTGRGQLFFKPHGEPEQAHDYVWQDRGFGGDCVHSLQAQVIDDLAAGALPANTGEAYLRNIAIEEAVYRSQAEARTIAV